jgi:hypothetical protein
MARKQANPTETVEHFEVWCDIAGERRQRKAENEGDVAALVDEIAADLRHAVLNDDTIVGPEAKEAAIEAAIASIDAVKVTLTKEPVPITTGS